jgi:hypothetical protein
MRCHPVPGGGPGNLFWDVREVRSVQVGIHGFRLKAHGGHGEVFVNDASMGMILQHQIDCPVDLLLHMPAEALAACAARRGELPHTLLFEGGSQLRLATTFLAIAPMTLRQLAMKAAILFACTGRNEIGDADIHTDFRG